MRNLSLAMNQSTVHQEAFTSLVLGSNITVRTPLVHQFSPCAGPPSTQRHSSGLCPAQTSILAMRWSTSEVRPAMAAAVGALSLSLSLSRTCFGRERAGSPARASAPRRLSRRGRAAPPGLAAERRTTVQSSREPAEPHAPQARRQGQEQHAAGRDTNPRREQGRQQKQQPQAHPTHPRSARKQGRRGRGQRRRPGGCGAPRAQSAPGRPWPSRGSGQQHCEAGHAGWQTWNCECAEAGGRAVARTRRAGPGRYQWSPTRATQ